MWLVCKSAVPTVQHCREKTLHSRKAGTRLPFNQINEMIFWLCKLRASTFVLFYYDLRVAFTSIQLLPFAYSNEEFAFGQRFIAAFCKWQVKLIYGTYTTLWNISHYFNASNIIISAFLHQNETYCIVLVKYVRRTNNVVIL